MRKSEEKLKRELRNRRRRMAKPVPSPGTDLFFAKEAHDQILDEREHMIERLRAQVVGLSEKVDAQRAVIKAYRSARDFWFEKHVRLERKFGVKEEDRGDSQG